MSNEQTGLNEVKNKVVSDGGDNSGETPEVDKQVECDYGDNPPEMPGVDDLAAILGLDNGTNVGPNNGTNIVDDSEVIPGVDKGTDV